MSETTRHDPGCAKWLAWDEPGSCTCDVPQRRVNAKALQEEYSASPPPGASAGREEPAASPLSAKAAAMIGALTGCAAMVQAIEGDSPTISEALHEWATAKSDLSRYVASLESALAAERAAGAVAVERLHWLAMNPDRIYQQNAVHPGWNYEGFHDEEEGWADNVTNRWYRDLNEAIDAARALAADRETEE